MKSCAQMVLYGMIIKAKMNVDGHQRSIVEQDLLLNECPQTIKNAPVLKERKNAMHKIPLLATSFTCVSKDRNIQRNVRQALLGPFSNLNVNGQIKPCAVAGPSLKDLQLHLLLEKMEM